MSSETPEEIAAKIDALSGAYIEADHDEAEGLLVDAAPDVVREAYRRLRERAGAWWYSRDDLWVDRSTNR